MQTRCSPGSLALVIAEHPGCGGNIGRVVEVRGPLESDDGRPCWHIQPSQSAPWLILERDGTVSCERVTWASGVIHPDAWLTPLSESDEAVEAADAGAARPARADAQASGATAPR